MNGVASIRQVVRSLRRAPSFTALVVLTLAAGITATTTVFSVLSSVLLAPLPFPDESGIVQAMPLAGDGPPQTTVSEPNFLDWRARTRSFAAIAQYAANEDVSIETIAEPVRGGVAMVSADFYRVLGVQPSFGRGFDSQEQQEGGIPAAIVTSGFADRELGGARRAIGSRLRFWNRTYTVVGVSATDVAYPSNVDVWVPRELDPPETSRTAGNWQVIARVAPGVSVEAARRDLSDVSRAIAKEYGNDAGLRDATIVPLHERVTGSVRPAVITMMAGAILLFLIACGNVANLMLARATAREGELAVRMALGASRGAVVRYVAAEAGVLAAASAVLAILSTFGVVAVIARVGAGVFPRAGNIHVDVAVLAFGGVAALVAGLLTGGATTLHATRADIRDTLSQAQRSQVGSSMARIRRSLVSAQIAFVLVLLVGGALLARSFIKLFDVDTGYRRGGVLLMDVPTVAPANDRAQLVRTYDALLAQLRGIPGVQAVGMSTALPIAGRRARSGRFLIVDSPAPPSDEKAYFAAMPELMRDRSRTGTAQYRLASAGYFQALGIPLLRGRLFDETDATDSPPVALISASLAAARWPNADPIGRFVQFGNMDGDLRPMRIVGVVGDVRDEHLSDPPQAIIYGSYRQRQQALRGSVMAIATGGTPPTQLIADARRALRDIRPEVPPKFVTIDAALSSSVADRRFVLALTAAFALAAFFLAVVGVYGVIGFTVEMRRQEMGVRIALGADRADILRLVLGQGMQLVLAGIGTGLLVALGATRLLRGLLFAVGPSDPASYILVAAALLIVALLASWIPARRASRTDPASVLRG